MSTDKRESTLASEPPATDLEQIFSTYRELQGVNLEELFAKNNYEALANCLECMNKITLAAAAKSNELTVEESKLDQQLGLFEERAAKSDVDTEMDSYKQNFNRNVEELKCIDRQYREISGIQMKGEGEVAEVTYRGIYKIRLEYEKEGWRKLKDIRIISPIEIDSEQFRECCRECVQKDDHAPLWIYLSSHLN